MMQGWGLDPENDQDKIYSIGYGGFVRKKDADLLHTTTARHAEELAAAIAADPTGDGFICEMFRCELDNHEYSYTMDLSDTLEAEGEGGSLSLMDVIRVEDNMLEDLSAKDAGKTLRVRVEECLDDREKLVITLRYGLTGATPLTQREIAQQCHISRSYVSRIEKKALEKLKASLEKDLC